jgi:hypothetical protein
VQSIVLDSTNELPARRNRVQKGAARRDLVLRTFNDLTALGPVTTSALDDAVCGKSPEKRRLFREARTTLIEQGYLEIENGHVIRGPVQSAFDSDHEIP